MNDGGMGSIKFVGPDTTAQKYGSTIAEAEFYDDDGVTVSTALFLDQYGKLFELDIWKVDFSPLRRYPAVSEIKNINRSNNP